MVPMQDAHPILPASGVTADVVPRRSVTRADIVRALRDLGVRSDALLMVHSSLSSLGWVEGGAEAVIEALLEAVAAGTVVMPTYTRYIQNPSAFDPATSPSDCGVITERLRVRPDVIRQRNNPRHSIAVWGRHKEKLTESRAYTRRFFLEHGGQVVLIGVGHETHSFLHADVDAVMQHVKPQVPRVRSMLFPRLEPWLARHGGQRSTVCGTARLRLIEVAMLRTAVERALADRPDLFDAPPSPAECAYKIATLPLERVDGSRSSEHSAAHDRPAEGERH